MVSGKQQQGNGACLAYCGNVMAIGLYTPISIYEDVVDVINNNQAVNTQTERRVHRSEPWKPPVYTSMRGWMFMNYLLLMLLIALPCLLAYAIIR
jgi:hypothetical protein